MEVLSDPGKVGGLLSRFLGGGGHRGRRLHEEPEGRGGPEHLADMVNEIDDEDASRDDGRPDNQGDRGDEPARDDKRALRQRPRTSTSDTSARTC